MQHKKGTDHIIRTNIKKEEIERLLTGLVSIESPSGKELKAMKFIETQLKINNISFEKQHLSASRYNLISTIGSYNKPGLLFNTHIDTVPAYNSKQLIPKIHNGYLSGRGACDAKGSVVGMLLAFISIAKFVKLKNISLTLAIMVGEENSGDGVFEFVKREHNYKMALIGEPTDLKIASSQAGYIEIILVATSKPGHAFDPVNIQSAQLLTISIQAIFEYIETFRKVGLKVHGFIKWMNCGSNDTFWYTRPQSTASILINIPPELKIKIVIDELKLLIDKVSKSAFGARIKLIAEDWDQGIYVRDNFWGVRLLELSLINVIGKSQKICLPSWTDGSTLFSKGIPTIIFGPGKLRDAHTEGELVKINDIKKFAITLALLTTESDKLHSKQIH